MKHLKHLGSMVTLTTLCGDDWMDGGLADLSTIKTEADVYARSTCKGCQQSFLNTHIFWFEVSFENGCKHTLPAVSEEDAKVQAVESLLSITNLPRENLVRVTGVRRSNNALSQGLS